MKSHKLKYLLASAILIIVIVGVCLAFFKSQAATGSVSRINNGCIGKHFGSGSSGTCVSDIQTMVNFTETDNLNQCPFTGSKPLDINGSYEASTQAQVRVIQTWFNCYNKQEGQPIVIGVTGIVNKPTWSDLCTYAYQYPSQNSQSSSPYRKSSIAAGKNAGC
jgi:hypothetical protein